MIAELNKQLIILHHSCYFTLSFKTFLRNRVFSVFSKMISISYIIGTLLLPCHYNEQIGKICLPKFQEHTEIPP